MSSWNDRTSLIVMKKGPGGELVPATESEIHLGVDAWQADRVTRVWGSGGGTPGKPIDGAITTAQQQQTMVAHNEGRLGAPVVTSTMQAAAQTANSGGTCPPVYASNQSYMAPGVTGSCRLEKTGVAEIGLHNNRAIGAGPVSTTVQAVRAATILRLAAYGGGGLENWTLSHFDVDQDQLIHSTGRLVPAGVFSSKAAFPVAFNLGVGTSDNIRIDSGQLVTTAGLKAPDLAISGINQFIGGGYPGGAFAPLPAMGRRSRQIVLGLTNAGVTIPENNLTATISGQSAVPIRMGALTLSSVWSATPDATPAVTSVSGDLNGIVPANGVSALSYMNIDSFDVNGISFFTQEARTGAGVNQHMPAYNFHPESNALWAPNSIVTPSDTINVVCRNTAPVGAGATVNDMLAIAAVVGCERLAVC